MMQWVCYVANLFFNDKKTHLISVWHDAEKNSATRCCCTLDDERSFFLAWQCAIIRGAEQQSDSHKWKKKKDLLLQTTFLSCQNKNRRRRRKQYLQDQKKESLTRDAINTASKDPSARRGSLQGGTRKGRHKCILVCTLLVHVWYASTSVSRSTTKQKQSIPTTTSVVSTWGSLSRSVRCRNPRPLFWAPLSLSLSLPCRLVRVTDAQSSVRVFFWVGEGGEEACAVYLLDSSDNWRHWGDAPLGRTASSSSSFSCFYRTLFIYIYTYMGKQRQLCVRKTKQNKKEDVKKIWREGGLGGIIILFVTDASCSSSSSSDVICAKNIFYEKNV